MITIVRTLFDGDGDQRLTEANGVATKKEDSSFCGRGSTREEEVVMVSLLPVGADVEAMDDISSACYH